MTDWRPGDEVYAMLGIDRGSYAEHVIVKAQEAARKPTSLDHTAAAAVPLAGLTAWQGLFRYGGLQKGQRVLIHGGSGGVGHFAVQFAKARGAQVITTASEKHVAFARDLGADQVLDYKKQRFEDVVRDVDMVFDLIAGETQDRSWRVLRKGGILVSTLAEPSPEKAREFAIGAPTACLQKSLAPIDQRRRAIARLHRTENPWTEKAYTGNVSPRSPLTLNLAGAPGFEPGNGGIKISLIIQRFQSAFGKLGPNGPQRFQLLGSRFQILAGASWS